MSLRDYIVITVRNEIRDFSCMLRSPYVRHDSNHVEMTVEGSIGECAICQEDFEVGETFVPLPCNDLHPHKFHKACIIPWIRDNNTCPTCRGSIR